MGNGICGSKTCLEEKDNNTEIFEYKNIEPNNLYNYDSFEKKGHLEKQSLIAISTYGRVLKVMIKETKEMYALKEGRLDLPQHVKTFVIEQDILQKCHHPNIVSIKDAFKDRSINSFIIVEEYAKGGTLRQQINEKKNIEENTLISWLTQICLALSYLHKKKIIHRDIKPDNIFLTGTQLIKIGDFGLSKEYKSLKKKKTIKIGTMKYMAPEINSGKYDEKVDIYSLGKTFNEFLELDKKYSKELVNLVNSFMEEDPAKRPSSDQILNSPIIKEGMKRFLKENNYENSLAKLIINKIKINNNNEKDDIFIKNIKNIRERLLHDKHYDYIEQEDSKDLDIIMCIINKKLNDII